MRSLALILPFALPALVAGLAPVPAAAAEPLFREDTIIVQKITSDRKAFEGERQLFLSGNRMKVREIKSEGTKEIIVDFAAKKVVVLDPKAKTFTEATFADLEKRIADGWEGFRKLPNEEQQKIRALASMMQPAKIERTDEFATIAGYKARRWNITLEQGQELWASPDFHLPPAYYDLNELMSPVMGPRGDAIRSRMRQLRAVDGFALRQVEHRGRPEDQYTVTTDTVEIRRGVRIPAAEFEVPKGFSKPAAREKEPSLAATPAAMSVPMR